MASKARMMRHLSERVLRQYIYVQSVPIPPTTIGPLEPAEVVTTFLEFNVHVLSQQQRGEPVPECEEWHHSKGYMKWFYHVSYPLMIAPDVVPEYTIRRPVYDEVIVEQQWTRHPPSPFQIINNIRVRVESAMEVPDVFSNPLVLCIMEGIRGEYSVLEEVWAPQRRSRRPQE
jgi:hypothetical protein